MKERDPLTAVSSVMRVGLYLSVTLLILGSVGHVIDFINTPWMMPAIYNIADIFIVSMMIGVALLVLVGLHLDGTREARRTTATDAGTGPGESTGGAAGDGEADAAASGSSKD